MPLFREDMITILGKRPFPERADEMDKWLDAQREKKSANNSHDEQLSPNGETAIPALFKKLD